MPARILDGRALAAQLRDGIAARSAALIARGVRPHLRCIMVGQDESSSAYVRSIERLGEHVRIQVSVDVLAPTAGNGDVRASLRRAADDPSIHGIILQQPLPPELSIRKIADAIPPHKDVDGANPINQGKLAFATGAAFVPATPAAVMLLLEHSKKWPLKGRDVTVIGRSNVVGLPVSLLIMAQDATVTVTHKETADLQYHVRHAEVLVVAAGAPRLVRGSWLKPGVTVIDVGTTMVGQHLVGDVDFESASKVAGEITPVPGGVGPVTNVALMQNVVSAAEAAIPAAAAPAGTTRRSSSN